MRVGKTTSRSSSSALPEDGADSVDRGRGHVIGVSDAHAAVGCLTGGAVFLLSAMCCVDRIRKDEIVIAGFALAGVSLWTSLFGLVLRGSWVTRLAAACGLACFCVAGFTAMMTVLLD